MNTKFSILAVALSLLVFLSACKKDDPVDPAAKFGSNYIINYGGYSGDKGGISLFNMFDSTVTNGYYESINGVATVSNAQYAYNANGNIYFMGNNADQIFFVDEKSFEQTANAISGTDLVKPRYCVADGNTLYVSCWGGDVWSDATLSYITKIDLTTNTVVGKITLHGGAEGLALVNGKLYAALNYDNKIAVIDLSDETISYIEAPAVSTYFEKDQNDNLYVTFVSYTPTETKLGHINTQTDVLTTYNLDGISPAYVDVLEFNNDFSKLYVNTSTVVSFDPYTTAGSIAVFDTNSKTFEANTLVSNVVGLNGIATNPESEDIFYFISEGTTANGKMVQVKPDGTEIKQFTTGIAPFMMLTVK